ncbi:MAG: NUDIX domain-containing protein [Actinomycetota bacterium]
MSKQIRLAASVIVGRDGSNGLEVLVLERSATSRFLPSYVVFPGGAVDAQDADLADRWFGSRHHVFRAGALRELFEESSVAVTGSGVRAAVSLDAIDADPPAVETIPEVAHWIAPEDVPVRFDARYVAVAASAGVAPIPDGTEISAAWWDTPAALLAAWGTKKRKLYWPTYVTLMALGSCADVADLLALRLDTREPDDHELEYLHRSTFYDD